MHHSSKSNKTRRKRKPKINPVYSKEDYNSNDGMLTKIWGACMWHYLHTMSFNYPVHPTTEQKEHYRNFILNLQNVLPCGKCRENLKKNMQKLPLTMENMKSRESFSKYIYKLHECVNKMLKKRSGLSYKQVRKDMNIFVQDVKRRRKHQL